MLTEQEKMEALISLSMELNQVKDIDILMEHIITMSAGTEMVTPAM